MNEANYKTIDELFVPMRTQPPHIGHISLLEAACKSADNVIIGIGSANKMGRKNPYTADERELMLRKSLEDKGMFNYRFVHIPDFEKDDDWVNYLIEKCGVNYNTKVVSGNPWVQEIFPQRGYEVIKPSDLLGGDMPDICATQIRDMIAQDNPEWKKYAATGTLHYFERLGGRDRVARFYDLRQEYDVSAANQPYFARQAAGGYELR